METKVNVDAILNFFGKYLIEGIEAGNNWKRAQATSFLCGYIKEHCTYPSGVIRTNLEVRIAYTYIYSKTPKKLRKDLIKVVGISRATSYSWCRDANDDTLRITSCVRRG